MADHVLAGTLAATAACVGGLRRIKNLAGVIAAVIALAASRTILKQALVGRILASDNIYSYLRHFQRSFTVAAGQTLSSEVPCSNDALYALEVETPITGGTIILHGKNRADATAFKPIYSWVAGTKTQIKLTTATANDVLSFDVPLLGFYSLQIEMVSQATTAVIVPRWVHTLS